MIRFHYTCFLNVACLTTTKISTMTHSSYIKAWPHSLSWISTTASHLSLSETFSCLPFHLLLLSHALKHIPLAICSLFLTFPPFQLYTPVNDPQTFPLPFILILGTSVFLVFRNYSLLKCSCHYILSIYL